MSTSNGDTGRRPPTGSAVRRLADRYVDDLAAADPFLATTLGLPGGHGGVPDASPDGVQQRADVRRGLLRELAGVPDAEPGDALARGVLHERVGADLVLFDTAERLAPCDVVAGPLQQLRQVLDLVDVRDPAAAPDVLSRLRGVPDLLHGWQRSLAASRAADGTPAPPLQRRLVLANAQHAERLCALVSALPERVAHGPGALRGDVERAAAAAVQALEESARALRGDVAAAATPVDGVGPDRYGRWARWFLGTDVDPVETYAWGEAEVARLRAEVERAGQRLGADGDDVRAVLDADPHHTVRGRDALRGWLQDLADRTTSALDGTAVDVPPPLRRLDVVVDDSGASGTHYTSPSEDASRPGVVWWAVAPGATVFPTWRAATTLVHEGVPGHHLHLGGAVLRAEELDRFRRLACYAPGTTEGWALYAERLVAELGHLAEPAWEYGLLLSQLWRAGRVLVDLGLHLRLPLPTAPGLTLGVPAGTRWTRDLAAVFLRDVCLLTDPYLVAYEVDRYLGRPGQALAYALGERALLAARDEAQRTARSRGTTLDLRRWHADVLALGPMGLDTLRSALVPAR